MYTREALFPGVALQAGGVVLLAVVSRYVARAVRRDYARHWSLAFVALALGLACALVALRAGPLAALLRSVFYLAHYAFGYLLILGCRAYAETPPAGRPKPWLVAAPALALLLGFAPLPLRDALALHAAVVGLLFGLALWRLWPLQHGPRSGPALRILLLALLLLTLDSAHHVAVLTWLGGWGEMLPFGYVIYAPLAHLMFQVLLAFGMVTVVMEDTNRRLQDAVRELRAAKERLEMVARIDPLTDSLNRHALHSVIEEQRRSAGGGGCVGMVDIDDLKGLNDTWGHAVGDAAIRAVARAIRALVRADDLVFRWGGDEFLLLLFGLHEDDARTRLSGVNAALTGLRLPGVEREVSISVSVGVAPILPGGGLDKAIEAADTAMYRRKHARKAAAQA